MIDAVRSTPVSAIGRGSALTVFRCGMGAIMIKRRNKRRAEPQRNTQIVELQRLLTSPVPSRVIEELSEPVAKALLLSFVMDVRYGNE